MKKLFTITAGALLGTLLLTAPKAHAQDPIMALDPTLMAGWTGNTGNAAWSKSHHKAASVKTNFAYTSTPALRQRTVSSFAKRMQGQNQAGAQALSTAFGPGKTDYGQVYQQMLKTSALHDNNAADALAGLMLTGYMIVNNVKDEQVTPAMERGARAQVAGILAQNPQIKSSAVRAQIGEEFKLQTILLASGWLQSIKSNTQPAYQQGIAAMFQNQYHMDLRNYKLTAQGFGKK
ncbi:hypothetical protein [Mucilaginibacter sp.]